MRSRREQFRHRVNMYTIKEEREIEPQTFAQLVSSTLYERRFGPYFIEPVIAGMQKKPTGGLEPFIAATDLIGCLNFAKDFVVAGTASEKLFGVAEGLWEPDLEPDDLFETISQTLLNAVDRDAFSGWGAVVHVMCVVRAVVYQESADQQDLQNERQGRDTYTQRKNGLELLSCCIHSFRLSASCFLHLRLLRRASCGQGFRGGS